MNMWWSNIKIKFNHTCPCDVQGKPYIESTRNSTNVKFMHVIDYRTNLLILKEVHRFT